MYVLQRTLTFAQSFLKSYGPSNIKRVLWDKEYSGSKWDFADNTVGDCVYPHLERHSAMGSILDLGCGSGNTANEVSNDTYCTYVGVDISETCLNKALRRTLQNGREEKNRFVRGDFLSYVPTQKFDVILFRESMYHVPVGKVKGTLDRYSKWLNDSGVFIVRMNASGGKLGRPKAMMHVMETEFEVLEKKQYGESGLTVIVFRPRAPIAGEVDGCSGSPTVKETHA